MLGPLRVSEGDFEESAFALAPACCGVRGQMLVSTTTLVSVCDCIAWNCITTSCVALNIVPDAFACIAVAEMVADVWQSNHCGIVIAAVALAACLVWCLAL